MITYHSTRGGGSALSSAAAIIQGLAADKGLFVPDAIPALPLPLSAFSDLSYQEVAEAIIGAFFTDFTKEEISSCVHAAYDGRFATDEIVPVRAVGNTHVMELYHGPTSAFKDMALSILPHLMTTARKKCGETGTICILTATSGDTGKAALEGFADVAGTEIIVFFPNAGVSPVQQRQMQTQEGANTHVFAIKGNFDDAQRGVKAIFNDPELAARLAQADTKLSSANSINIGRLVPQVAYYVYAYSRLVKDGSLACGEPMNVVVPTGNFGNILAAWYAGRMGVPIGKLICASNANRVLTDFLRTGVYDTHRPFHLTNSPSMDILVSSNLERLLYALAGDDAEAIRSLMAALDQSGRYEVSAAIRDGLSSFYGGFADPQETLDTIGQVFRTHGYLLDTHTAVAWKVYEDYVQETGDETPAVIASTASPFKFAGDVAKAIGLAAAADEFADLRALAAATGLPIPAGLADLETKPLRHTGIIEKTAMAATVEEVLR